MEASATQPTEPEQGEVLPADPRYVPGVENGHGPRYATVDEILANAPKDIVERDVTGVFGGSTIRVRSLTAAQSAHIRQKSLILGGRSPDVVWAEMERLQFELAVVEPKFTKEQVLMLHRMSGPSFSKVIGVIDEMSGIGKEELRTAQKEFQERGELETI